MDPNPAALFKLQQWGAFCGDSMDPNPATLHKMQQWGAFCWDFVDPNPATLHKMQQWGAFCRALVVSGKGPVRWLWLQLQIAHESMEGSGKRL